jgi:hypothetical protein
MRTLNSILAMLAAVFAALMTPAQGMTFKVDKFVQLKPADPGWYVYGSGEIIDGNAKRLLKSLEAANASVGETINVYLDSPGGSVAEGLMLGYVISEIRADTLKPAPGTCASACVLAYLGGRFADDTKIEAGAATVITQVLAAKIVKFIRESRADTQFFTLMTSTLPTEIYFLPPDKLRDLRVVTDAIWDENWSFEVSEKNDYYLKIWQRGYYGEHKLILYCNEKRIFGSAILEPPENPVGPFTVALFLNGQPHTIPEKLILIQPNMNGKFMTSSFVVEASLVSRLLTAQTIGVVMRPPNKDLLFGFQISTAKGRDKLSKMIGACR